MIKSQSILYTGFFSILLLMAIFTSIAFSVLDQSVERIDTIVNINNAKSELLNRMRTMARERNITLQKMLHETSEPLIEQLWKDIGDYGGQFVYAREQLLAMELTPQERAFLKLQSDQSQVIAPLQHRIAELIIFNDRQAASQILNQQALPLQDKVFEVLSDLLNIQKQTAAMAVEDAAKDYRQAMVTMALVAVVIFFVSITIIVYIIKRITATESKLLFHKDNLEALVDARTQELEGALRLAEQANITKSEFVSTVSHELRTPLTSIKAALGLINGGAVGSFPKKMQMMLDIAESNTGRLIYLINDLLDIQKIESGKIDFDFSDVDVHEILRRAVNNASAHASNNGVDINIKSDYSVDTVFTDAERLLQVIDNVLSNAIKFSTKNDVIDINVKDLGAEIKISVADHGDGIPLAFQDKLFDKFTQADASDTRSYGGTGLGMNISRSIMLELQGSIDFTSSNAGTTFWVEIPKQPGAKS
ncbi:MAG: ATP-binding protein [Gammaproteobacteria bacterium]|nr:ATP-binding protein [Gammaproteobacteria bacterium]